MKCAVVFNSTYDGKFEAYLHERMFGSQCFAQLVANRGTVESVARFKAWRLTCYLTYLTCPITTRCFESAGDQTCTTESAQLPELSQLLAK
jgi:hypothetical protein